MRAEICQVQLEAIFFLSFLPSALKAALGHSLSLTVVTRSKKYNKDLQLTSKRENEVHYKYIPLSSKNIETQCIQKKSEFYNHVYELYTFHVIDIQCSKTCLYTYLYIYICTVQETVSKSRVPFLFYFDISCKYSCNFTLHECPRYI